MDIAKFRFKAQAHGGLILICNFFSFNSHLLWEDAQMSCFKKREILSSIF